MAGRQLNPAVTLPTAFEPDLEQWDAWSPEQVTRVLAPVEAPWYVAAGWAIDLFLGGGYREHDDLEIAVPRDRFHEIVEALAGFELFVVGVPRHGLVSPLEQAIDALEATHQTWVREPETGFWRLDVMREPSDGDRWICRRDERIRLPYDEVIERTADGIPYGRPEIVLLFKAKNARPKDDADLAATLPLLGPEQRRWLSDVLAVVHPGHRWLTSLET
jgi:capsular polysaccharide biosynthesis protein